MITISCTACRSHDVEELDLFRDGARSHRRFKCRQCGERMGHVVADLPKPKSEPTGLNFRPGERERAAAALEMQAERSRLRKKKQPSKKVSRSSGPSFAVKK